MPKLLTLTEVVSQAAMEIGISQQDGIPVMTSRDQDVTQMRSLLNAVAAEVLSEEPYLSTLGDQYWIADSDGFPKDSFTADDDVILFDGRLAVQGVKWRFLQGKGLEFGEPMRDFTARLNKLAARANARVLDLDLDGSRVQ
jgi:hypothetical protein